MFLAGKSSGIGKEDLNIDCKEVGRNFNFGDRVARIVIIVLVCVASFLLISLIVTCICFKSKRKEQTVYNAIEM